MCKLPRRVPAKAQTTEPSQAEASAVSDTAVVVSPGDGKSFETAVLIREKTEDKGIHAEYVWISEHYTNYKIVRQSLSTWNKKPFDVITIELGDSSKKDIYFDISRYYGHF
jgi:hypothetical protein